MSDPVRLREAGDPFEIGLLESARDDVAGKHVHKNVRTALGIGTGIAIASTASSAAGAGATKGATTLAAVAAAKWIGVIVITGIALGEVSAHIDAPRSARQTASTPTPTRIQSPIPTKPWTPNATWTATATSPPPATARPTAPSPSLVPAAPSPAASSLLAELAPLDAARAAFDSGNTALALEQINRHDTGFPHGQLAPEALALRIEIYALKHENAKVLELTTRFLTRYPSHPQAARMRSLADEASHGKEPPAP